MAPKYCYGCMRPIQAGESICPICGYLHGHEVTPEYALQPGMTLQSGKYLVGKILGRGGFGITYIALDQRSGAKVAIKEYYPMGQVMRILGSASLHWDSSVQSPEASQESFLKEARKMAKVAEIPGIVKVREVFRENNTAYIVMSFVEGETLKTILRQGGPMKPENCLELLYPVIEAMGRVHRMGMIHRDISPDNIMVDIMGRRWVLDMGAAKDMDPRNGQFSQSSQTVIKRGFSPPEQYTDRDKVGTWSDVYAMCATIYYCITGKLPQDAIERAVEDELVFTDPIPRKLANVLRKGMAIRTQDRIQTMGELYTALHKCGVTQKTKAPEKSEITVAAMATQRPEIRQRPTEPQTSIEKLKKINAGKLGVVLLLCIILGLGSFFMLIRRDLLHSPASSKPAETPVSTVRPERLVRPEVGDTVSFGHYEQDNDTTNGPEAIEWQVLEVQGDRALLVSHYGLEYHLRGNGGTWESSFYRSWLNDSFLKEAFSVEEQAGIPSVTVSADKNPKYDTDPGNDTEDKIFFLSIAEVEKYFSSEMDRQCKPSAYTEAKNLSVHQPENTCNWWLRSPGESSSNSTYVEYSGAINYEGTIAVRSIAWEERDASVRPALWVEIDVLSFTQPEATTEPTPAQSPMVAPTPALIINPAIGDIVTLGHYEQDNDLANGLEEIEWIVLDVQDGKGLLISRYALDGQPYNTSLKNVTWETCSLRTWLNNNFLNTAFSKEELAMIPAVTVSADKNPDYNSDSGNNTTDRVFLLSITEANRYFTSDVDRQCEITEFAKERCYVDQESENCWWWLRTPGNYPSYAAYVYSDGSARSSGFSVHLSNNAVRPALWINLAS